MFISRMIETDVQEPIAATDEFNYEYFTYKDPIKANVYITQQAVNDYNANDLDLVSTQYVAYTTERNIAKDWLVDGKRVDYVVPARNFNTLYLVEVE